MNSIQERWEEYRATLGPMAGEDIIEARLNFYSGATAIYNMMMGKALDENVTQREGEEFLESLSVEINRFMTQILTREGGILGKEMKNAR
jgi:hypothetical protein